MPPPPDHSPEKTGFDDIARRLGAIPVILLAIATVVLTKSALFSGQITAGGFVIDQISSIFMVVIATIGISVYRYSVRFLDGEGGRNRFLGWLVLTIAAAFALTAANDLRIFFLCWLTVSLGLHRLLTHYGDRPAAMPP
ncbi:MAG TPA: hypothetical protein VHA37_02530, partial [Candidatus Saccharimonadales bacterium]|nr:hypothetical protein [Candidatus Saccharimonadales bacterium]